jgi:uncharacterized membrane protein
MVNLKIIRDAALRWPEVVRPFRRRVLLLLVMLTMTVAYSALSISRHRHFSSSAFDLGVFDQAVWHYSRFEPPYNSFRTDRVDENILGDHFHPILVLLAPLYWFTDSVEALLAAQALLFVIPILPIFLFTEKRLGRLAAYLFAFSYSIYWGVQLAVEFDFHEIAFAVPLIAFAIYFIDKARWGAYAACVCLLLLTKEDLSVLVVFFGFYLISLGQVRKGLVSAALGSAWLFLTLKLFIPFFSSKGGYRYWDYGTFGTGPLDSILTIFRNPLLLIKTLFTPAIKLRTCWLIFSPFLLLACFSPLIILAIPLLAERFLSNIEHYWGPAFHYTASISPVVAMASADALGRLSGLIKEIKVRRLVIASLSFVILAINLYLLPSFPLWKLTDPSYRHLTASDRTGRAALAIIPRDASVTAQNNIVPHLSHRRNLFLIRPVEFTPESEYIVASSQLNPYPFADYKDIEAYLAQRQASYSKIFERDGWVVLKRNESGRNQSPLVQVNEDAEIGEIVAAIYERILGREPEPEGLRFWSEQIAINRRSIKSVVKQFALSDEFVALLQRQGSTKTAVRLIYQRLLVRAPGEDEIKSSAGLDDAGDFRALIQNLLDGAEYNSKFGECGVPGERVITDKRCSELQR